MQFFHINMDSSLTLEDKRRLKEYYLETCVTPGIKESLKKYRNAIAHPSPGCSKTRLNVFYKTGTHAAFSIRAEPASTQKIFIFSLERFYPGMPHYPVTHNSPILWRTPSTRSR